MPLGSLYVSKSFANSTDLLIKSLLPILDSKTPSILEKN
ncbi:MAG: hypothetical protein Ct9H300mP20_11480 [Gammaproteobacteria bacterium]|nr:MAG: hypothetical protein Ct9H300mP20_11480 [Gammaproteobacteria bacterium]